jgi:hypothetical protein
MCITLPL